MHPLQIDLSSLSEEEFHRKRNDLVNRMHTAYRMGYTDAVFQIQMLLDDYQTELQRRDRILLDKLNKDIDQLTKPTNIG